MRLFIRNREGYAIATISAPSIEACVKGAVAKGYSREVYEFQFDTGHATDAHEGEDK